MIMRPFAAMWVCDGENGDMVKRQHKKHRPGRNKPMRRLIFSALALLVLTATTRAADQVKLGIFTELSGAISPPGNEGKRGMDLALEALGNKLGGLPVKITVVDTKTNPSEAVQVASKLIDEEKVDFVIGFAASNTTIPVWKSFSDAGIFAIGTLAGPN